MALFGDPIEEVYAQVELFTESLQTLDSSGFSEIKMRLQLGAADEFSITLPAQDLEGVWRADMPVWQVGGTIYVQVGFDGLLDFIQVFEIVSTTVRYPGDTGGEEMTVRGVSDLARAARNKKPRTFSNKDSFQSALSAICNEYGWVNNVVTNEATNNDLTIAGGAYAAKKSGESDLKYLKRVAAFLRLGGPRLDGSTKYLTMPEPEVGDLTFVRGNAEVDSYRRLHTLSMNREGGQSTRVRVTAWDPETQSFVEKEFEADKFGGDPNITFEGPASTKGLEPPGDDVQTMTYAIAVVEHRGQGKQERVDVISSSEYLSEISAEELATRYFELREKLGRWATAVVDGVYTLKPYVSFNLEGSLANVDRGTWLPIWVEHKINSTGWKSNCRVIRVVEEPPPVTAVDE